MFAALTACMLVTGCIAPTWLTDAEALMPVLIASGTSILSFIGVVSGNPEIGAALAVAMPIIKDVLAGLKDLDAMIREYKGTKDDSIMTKIEDTAAVVRDNLSKLLADVGLPAVLAAKLSQWAELVISQLDAWLEILPAIKTGVETKTIAHMPKPASDKVMRADDLKNAFNNLLDQPTGDPTIDDALAAAPRL